MTSAASTARFAEQLRAEGVTASYVSVRGDGHAMLRRASLWHELAVGFLIGTLLPDAPQSSRAVAPNYLPDVIRGVARITI